MNVASAVVLAAGEGQRLRPLTKHRPKPMLPAANRPILEHVLDAIIDAGITDLHLVVGYKRERVQDHFGSTYRGHGLTYHHQRKQLGSGHALLQADGEIEADFLVVNGDQLISTQTVSEVINAHSVEDIATLAIVESDDAPQYGAVRMENDHISALVEKPHSDEYRLLNAGVYVFAPSFFVEVENTPRENGELSLTDTLIQLLNKDELVRGIQTDEVWHDATYPWDLLSLAKTLLVRPEMIATPVVDSSIYVDESAIVHDDATLRGPVVIGPDSVIGPQAIVGPDTAVGRNVTVDAGAVVASSVIDDDTRIGPNATLAECVTGQDADIDAGTTISGATADVRIGTRVHENVTLGGVIADRAHLGSGTTLSPGVLIGPNAEIHPGSHITSNVREGMEVRD
ncbi:glucose-1-phosphate thymidylyltransferase [Halogranum amylolyticum]|uniref:Bifunctional protein GlmU n=1 Tax=Halogranum amylolyticum TaxID=660520 RepID=A0A1H8WQL4_9EURY|nr:bifunctional sugar-1-phosphate nucleotidylyltransferase/acetyltransferase [Halogranum amylolyticum]SEP29793.1 glucose-1-phosphate thymidylyltransferase [Halogranum amylolyticum]